MLFKTIELRVFLFLVLGWLKLFVLLDGTLMCPGSEGGNLCIRRRVFWINWAYTVSILWFLNSGLQDSICFRLHKLHTLLHDGGYHNIVLIVWRPSSSDSLESNRRGPWDLSVVKHKPLDCCPPTLQKLTLLPRSHAQSLPTLGSNRLIHGLTNSARKPVLVETCPNFSASNQWRTVGFAYNVCLISLQG